MDYFQREEIRSISTATDTKPLKALIVKPHLPLRVAKRLNDFLHLEPLELEILAVAVPESFI